MTLQEIKDIDCSTVNRTTLVDISNIEIDASLPREEWMRTYLQQIKNPYLFLCNGVVVKVSFSDTTTTIEDKLEEYICQQSKK